MNRKQLADSCAGGRWQKASPTCWQNMFLRREHSPPGNQGIKRDVHTTFAVGQSSLVREQWLAGREAVKC